MNKKKQNKNALTVGITVSALLIVCLSVVGSANSTRMSVNDEGAVIQENTGNNEVSVNDIIELNSQSESSDVSLEPETADNRVATNPEYENETEIDVSTNVEDTEVEENANSITVSVDGYDLADATWPVSSKEVVMEYSYNTTPVYSKTYNEYRSDHTGIDIKASIGEEVRCAYKGKVVEIISDARLGKLVKVEHAEGVYSIYANLDENVRVTLNQKVDEGEVIGAVGNTAASESAEDTHLHFGVIAFGDYVNPLDYIKAE